LILGILLLKMLGFPLITAKYVKFRPILAENSVVRLEGVLMMLMDYNKD
jgi:hypothetical protein